MILKEVLPKFGFKFMFQKDIDQGNIIPYMVVRTTGYINAMYAIVNLDEGTLAGFGEYDDILKDEIVPVNIARLSQGG